MCTGGQTCLSRLHRATAQIVHVVLTLFIPSQISCFTLLWQSQTLPFYPNRFPQMYLSPASAPEPWVEVHSCSLSSSFSPPFFHPTQLFGGYVIRIILSGGQGLLLVFSWHSIASVDVFWRDGRSKRHSTSTYSPSWLPPPKLIPTCPHFLHTSESWAICFSLWQS